MTERGFKPFFRQTPEPLRELPFGVAAGVAKEGAIVEVADCSGTLIEGAEVVELTIEGTVVVVVEGVDEVVVEVVVVLGNVVVVTIGSVITGGAR
jgi:hypothetical protein